ncbi:hypothetical protein C6N75_10095 [Streptomyces solincola]|uniref:Uncharacterized protein n=1 Tax=Streptomyces solincola TaxID=2100817 RepID=A0A2S9PYD5_9ACTN|nr:hypothetical protein [Streptomyces solincola]PRH79422.1 hypothetical protein C6N75_10095 [Streptomyces solincola]
MNDDRDCAELSAKADQLIAAMGAVAKSSGLQVSEIQERQRRQRMLVTGLIVSFALNAVLTIVIAVTGLGVLKNSDRLEDMQQRVGDQVICPYYKQLLKTEDDVPAGLTAEQLRERKATFVAIREGYALLGCKERRGW